MLVTYYQNNNTHIHEEVREILVNSVIGSIILLCGAFLNSWPYLFISILLVFFSVSEKLMICYTDYQIKLL